MIFFSLPLAISLLQALKLFWELKASKKQYLIHPTYSTLTFLTFISLLGSFIYLISRFAVTDLSYRLVYENSHTLKPMLYKISGTWGNHEGSMLLFIFIFSAYSYFYSKLSNFKYKNEVLGFQSAILFLILAYTYFTSNPFEPILAEFAGAKDGMGLNPLLQDVGLAIHPPVLYMGFAGFSLAFSTVLVVLKKNITDKSWAEYIRPWILFSWIFLSIGVALGAWWAYRELGWGGFWFWDPVENISLLPWLFSCALIHSIYTTKKFNRFAMLSVALALVTFISSLVGFFLVRSGLLSSVHTFASDPARGIFMLAIIFMISSYAAILFGRRYGEMRFQPEGQMFFISREIFILFQIILLVVMAITILLAIFYPMLLEIFLHKHITVGEPYFNAVFVPIALGLIVIMVFAPILKWQRERGITVIKKSLLSFFIALAIAAYLKLNFIQVTVFLAIAIFCCLWLVISSPEIIIRKLLKKDKVSKGFTAMIISHTAFGLLALAITLVYTFESDRQVNLKNGGTIAISGYDITEKNERVLKGPNYFAQKVDFEISRNSDVLATLSPENRIYFPGITKTHEAEIDYSIMRDIYVVMGQIEEGASAGADPKIKDRDYIFPVRIYIKPFISFVWFSVLLMAFGGFLAMLPKKK